MRIPAFRIAASTCLTVFALAGPVLANHQRGTTSTFGTKTEIGQFRFAERPNGGTQMPDLVRGHPGAFRPNHGHQTPEFGPSDPNQHCGGVPLNYPVSLINMGNGRSLDAHIHKLHRNGGWVQMWDLHGRANQKWVLVPVGRGFVKIVNQAGGLVLDADSRYVHRNGGRLQLWDWNGGLHQQWRLVPVGRGEFEQINRASGLALDADLRQIRRNGGRLLVWSPNHEPQQRWRIEVAPPIHIPHP